LIILITPDARCPKVVEATLLYRRLPMRIEPFADHHEAREALVLSIASVTAIMLIESLLLLILY
jgi:hypothetical protein